MTFPLRLALASFIALAAACGPPSISADGYDTSCSVDDDCILVAFDDPCSECRMTPISASEQERATAAIDGARAMCFVGVADCVQAFRASCDEGICVAAPLQ